MGPFPAAVAYDGVRLEGAVAGGGGGKANKAKLLSSAIAASTRDTSAWSPFGG
jgi:hypothetical protein